MVAAHYSFKDYVSENDANDASETQYESEFITILKKIARTY